MKKKLSPDHCYLCIHPVIFTWLSNKIIWDNKSCQSRD